MWNCRFLIVRRVPDRYVRLNDEVMNKERVLSLPLIALVNFVLPIWLGSAIFGLFVVSGLDGSRSPAQIMQGGILAVVLFPVFATLILGIPTLLYASLIVTLCSGHIVIEK